MLVIMLVVGLQCHYASTCFMWKKYTENIVCKDLIKKTVSEWIRFDEISSTIIQLTANARQPRAGIGTFAIVDNQIHN